MLDLIDGGSNDQSLVARSMNHPHPNARGLPSGGAVAAGGLHAVSGRVCLPPSVPALSGISISMRGMSNPEENSFGWAQIVTPLRR